MKSRFALTRRRREIAVDCAYLCEECRRFIPRGGFFFQNFQDEKFCSEECLGIHASH